MRESMERLAAERARARADRDFARADRLRDEIEAAGWRVRDTPEGYELAPKPPYQVHPSLKALPSAPVSAPRRVSVALLVDGWPDDVRRCAGAVLRFTEFPVVALDLGNRDGAGDVLHELAVEHRGRVEDWHVDQLAHWAGGGAGWGASRTALLGLDPADVHVVMETSTILEGDAITRLLAEMEDETVVAAGWKGVNPDADGRSWHDAAGDVRALLGYLFAVRRDRAEGFPAKARYYRNADLEFCLTLSGRLVAVAEPLPVRRARHRGYHDVDTSYREKESRRNYQRVMERLKHGGAL